MSLQRCLLFLIVTLLFAFSSAHAFAGTLPGLDKLPSKERWFGIFFNDERTGFSHVRIRENRSGYELYSESSVKMSGFAFSRDASIRETYLTNKDLSLQSFTVDQTIDGVPMLVRGEVSPTGVKALVDAGGKKKETFLKSKGPVYPPLALNLYPLLQRGKPAKFYSIAMLDPEAVKIKKVRITVVGPDTMGGLNTIHLRNDLYPVSNDIWVDYEGNTVKESLRDDWIVTLAEDEQTIRTFIANAALARSEFIGYFSRIKVDTPIAQPAALKKMIVELSDFPAGTPLPANAMQKAELQTDGKALVTVDITPTLPQVESADRNQDVLADYLQPTAQLPSDNPVVIGKLTEIAGNEKNPPLIAAKLARWVAAHVKDNPGNSASPLETLAKGEGNSLARARLFASLARAAGIPARPVLGIVYVRDQGFLYHCWAEIHIGHWLPVDPDDGAVPADATHIKLTDGDTEEDLVTLSGFVGKIRAKVIELQY